MTHDYKRHGTTTLFAALNIRRHRHRQQHAASPPGVIRFLNTIEAQVPVGKVIHAVVDNYATHKHRGCAENAALRHQLITLRRKVRGRVRLTDGDRLFFIQLYRWFPTILRAYAALPPYAAPTSAHSSIRRAARAID